MKEVDDCLVSPSYLWCQTGLYFQQCNFLSEVFVLVSVSFWTLCHEVLKSVHAKRSEIDGLEVLTLVDALIMKGWGDRYTLRIILAIFPSIYSCFIIEVVPKLDWIVLWWSVLYNILSAHSTPPTLVSLYEIQSIENGFWKRPSMTMMADACIALYRVKSLINTSIIGKLLCWDWHLSVC